MFHMLSFCRRRRQKRKETHGPHGTPAPASSAPLHLDLDLRVHLRAAGPCDQVAHWQQQTVAQIRVNSAQLARHHKPMAKLIFHSSPQHLVDRGPSLSACLARLELSSCSPESFAKICAVLCENPSPTTAPDLRLTLRRQRAAPEDHTLH